MEISLATRKRLWDAVRLLCTSRKLHAWEKRFRSRRGCNALAETLESRTHLDVTFDRDNSTISGQFEGQTMEMNVHVIGCPPQLVVDYGDGSEPDTFVVPDEAES